MFNRYRKIWVKYIIFFSVNELNVIFKSLMIFKANKAVSASACA